MKSRTVRVALVVALVAACGMAASAAADKLEASPAQPEAVRRWQDMRFGMFIHWGPVSLTGREIGWSRGSPTPIDEYDNLHKQFNPTNFNAAEWVNTAKEAGMKYMVFTTKHHDGFCMWDTKQSDYNIMNSPFGRDVVKELSEACRKEGVAFGTYYSVCDWRHPDFPRGSPGGKTQKPNPNLDGYVEYLRKQVAELVGNYGPLITMWFDVPQEVGPDRGIPTVNLVRSLQPDILINNRAGGTPGDFDTPEQRVGAFRADRPWETCMTICRQWAWKPDDNMKSLGECLQILIRTAGGNGNLLLNVGPMPDGRIEPRQAERLKEMGEWMGKCGESIYGTRGGPFKPNKSGASTHRGNTIYLHVMEWAGDSMSLPPIPGKIVKADLLTGGAVDVKQGDAGITVRVQPRDRREIVTIVKLELDGPAREIPPVEMPSL